MKINSLFLILAFCFCYGSYHFSMKTMNLMIYGQKVEAKVIELSKGSIKNSKGKPSIVYHPVFEYVISGKSYTQVSSVGTDPAIFDVGDKTNLFIDPVNPRYFIADTFFDKWGIPSFLAFMSLVLFMMSYFIGRKSSAKKSLTLKGKGHFIIILAEVTLITKKENNIYWFEASWTDLLTGRSHTFYFDKYFDATEVFKGKQIPVAINPENYTEYYPVLDKASIAA